MAELVYFFSTKAFLILAIIITKIVYLGFLVSYTSRVALIIQIFIVLNKLWSSAVSYISSFLASNSVLDLGLGSSSILFIVKY